ncbi:hypothetical protein [Clostridium sp. Marseille-Q2269]|uniref:hypothetical protein n=1 Tax=Clostridium sp. Marseille-Q2269 TaxID=2942205 RepID=UPI0020746450|nr:hypothetical protein [Clostridium sp. Marseille-Q2269]
MPKALIGTAISAAAIIVGAIIGGIWSSRINKKTIIKNEEIQRHILEEHKKIDEIYYEDKFKESGKIVRLDICTAIFEGIRAITKIQYNKEEYYPVCISINKNYYKDISILTKKFTLKEISYINQLYGIIDKINYDVKRIDYSNKNSWINIIMDYEILLKKIYGSKYKRILEIDVEECNYDQLIDNDIIKKGYRDVLVKLNDIID